MQQWELCIIETSTKEPFGSFEDYVIFHFYAPEEYRRLSSGSVLFDVHWESLDGLQKRALLNSAGCIDISYRDAMCKLLQEGWEPLGATLNGEGALVYTFRRPYAPWEPDPTTP